MRASLARIARANDVPVWVVTHLGRIRRAEAPIWEGVDEAVAQGGIFFRVSRRGDFFDVVGRLGAALLGLGQ